MPVLENLYWQANSRFRLGIVLIIVAALGRACVFRPGTDYPGKHFNQGANAAWLGVSWVNEPHSSSELASLADNLAQRQIQQVFVYAAYLKPDGQFSSTHENAPDFISGLKAANPTLNIQAWIGLPLDSVVLSDAAVREKIVRFCVELVRTTGFDGIHLDPEPIPTDEESVLILLDELRAALGPTSTLSIATRWIWPIFPDVRWPLVGRVAWRASYYREVSQRVDQMAVMTYDSALPFAFLYRQWTRFQVIEISRAVEDTDVQLFFGVPTSEEETRTHRARAENMRSGLEGVIDGLNDAQSHSAMVAGVAIYPYWETDEAEWRTYEKLWLGEPEVTHVPLSTRTPEHLPSRVPAMVPTVLDNPTLTPISTSFSLLPAPTLTSERRICASVDFSSYQLVVGENDWDSLIGYRPPRSWVPGDGWKKEVGIYNTTSHYGLKGYRRRNQYLFTMEKEICRYGDGGRYGLSEIVDYLWFSLEGNQILIGSVLHWLTPEITERYQCRMEECITMTCYDNVWG